ncbi:hypothetical protein B4168_3646 [Anoxybacillus flavithermus]|nr:hypothetical protein B4168_3646 [Anoxybacillus flavithermus]OAO87176.1 hypothetical protein GT23_1359 [Parageobacillus thermoglucosidasius]
MLEAMSRREQYHQVWENLYVKEIAVRDGENTSAMNCV